MDGFQRDACFSVALSERAANMCRILADIAKQIFKISCTFQIIAKKCAGIHASDVVGSPYFYKYVRKGLRHSFPANDKPKLKGQKLPMCKTFWCRSLENVLCAAFIWGVMLLGCVFLDTMYSRRTGQHGSEHTCCCPLVLKRIKLD